MGRYSPSVQQISALEALGQIGNNLADERDRRRAEAEQRLADTMKANREEAAFRLEHPGVEYRQAPPTVGTEPGAPDIFQGARPSLGARGPSAPPIFQDARLGPAGQPTEADGSTDGTRPLDHLARTRQEAMVAPSARGMGVQAPGQPSAFSDALGGLARPRKPKLIALPGAYVRNVGFTERGLTDQDLEALHNPSPTREYLTAEGPQPDQNMMRLSGKEGGPGYFQDRRTAPKSPAERQLEIVAAAREMGATPAEIRMIEADPDFAEKVYARIQGENKADTSHDYITVDGRDFPNTEAGASAAEAWRARMHPEQPSGPVRGSPEYLAALDAEERIRHKYDKPVPTTPVRGTPEYVQMIEDEARARAAASGTRVVRPNEMESQAYVNYPTLQRGVQEVAAALQANPKLLDNPALLSHRSIVRRMFLNDEERNYQSSVARVLATLIYIKSGKTINESEALRQAAGYIPGWGDTSVSASKKLDALNAEITNLAPIADRARQYYNAAPGTPIDLPDDPDAAAEKARRMMGGGR